MRKSKNTTLQWPKVSRLPTTVPRHRPDFRTGFRFSFWEPEVPVLRVRKSHFHCFSSLQKGLILCTSRFANFARGKWSNHDSKNCSEIRTVTWLVIWLWKLKFSIFVCLFVYLFVCTSRFANFARGKWSNHNSKNCSEIRAVTPF